MTITDLPAGAGTVHLPTRMREDLRGPAGRWKPERAGVVQVWQYGEETLEFEDGRLLLFGANGSGKTMLLELLLPYLLDARGQQSRLSTSGSDRGGLWDRVVGYESGQGRTGYLWITFARRTGVNDERFTCGVRLRAKPSGGGEHTWFTTSRSPGIDLSLLDDQRRPLDVAAFSEAIGDDGTVWGANTDGYRTAIRTTLYAGFNPLRLESLIASLLVVRKQSVTDGLSASRLNELLREGLPPLDDDEVDKLARGFEELDRRRERIATMTDDLAAAGEVRRAARSYARAVLAAHADRRVSTETRKDAVRRDERAAETKLGSAVTAQERIERELGALERRLLEVDGRLSALKDSDAYKVAGVLDTLRMLAAAANANAEQARKRANLAAATTKKLTAEASQHQLTAAEAGRQLTEAREHLVALAASAGLHTDPELAADAEADALAAQLDAMRAAVAKMRAALHDHALAIAARDRDADAARTADGKLTDAKDEVRESDRVAVRTLADWRAELADWVAHLEVLDGTPLAALVPDADDPRPVRRAAEAAYAEVAEQVAGRRQQLTTTRDQFEEDRTDAAAELARLEAGGIVEPEAPTGRRDRTGLAGAPLWQLVAFADDLGDHRAGRLEAALADAGLLDAWVDPDGQVHLEGPDLVLAPPLTSAETSSLADVLTAEHHPQVPAARIDAILSRVGWVDSALDDGPATLTFGADGTWRAGPVHGRARDHGPARFIGATSREHGRQRRITELREQIAGLDAAVAAIDRDLDALDRRRQDAADERDGVSVASEQSLVDARERATLAAQARQIAAAALAEASELLEVSEDRVRATLRAVHRVGSEHSLPTDADALDRREQAYRDTERQIDVVHRRVIRLSGDVEKASSAAKAAADAEARQADDEADADDLEGSAAREQARYEQTEATSGDDVKKVRDDIEREEADHRQVTGRVRTLRVDQRQTDGQVATATATLSSTTEKRQVAEDERDQAHRQFVHAATDLAADADLGVALNELESVTASLDAAQAVRAAVGNLSRTSETVAGALSRLEEKVYQAREKLTGRADLVVAGSGSFSALTCRVDGAAMRSPALVAGFDAQLQQARLELSAQEERVFEETLTGAVRDHLASRIRSAATTVRVVNGLLEHIETAAGGVKVQLRWEIDGSEVDDRDVLKRIRNLLLGSRHAPDERADLHTFLRRQIDQVRSAEDDTGNWKDRLARVLDYRRWHRFTVLVHHDRFGDQPVPFDSRKVSLSAGEKTVALTVPLIAAIAAHYLPREGEDTPDCPRLLLMDELFPKVDRANKRLLLGLINDLGLDVVFTSDKDWCDYDTLDAIAIHVVQKDGDASLTTRFVWNGSQRAPAPPAGPSDGTLHGVLAGGGA
ncbi:TIGR02680 family protein [Nitriliruptor alkaliphilus]|uniref:TIGR02680 family protein n=1 Tax=Nitriliruptor alkaliphilus TaxID=427918 RepID=UPI000697AABE|nr:TIGR02680 family protein [Nitriliruptor alkaliphilus]